MSPTTEDTLKRDFKRSRWFGLGGVVVVMVLVAVLALAFGQNTANPTGLYIVIFVLIFGFVARQASRIDNCAWQLISRSGIGLAIESR